MKFLNFVILIAVATLSALGMARADEGDTIATSTRIIPNVVLVREANGVREYYRAASTPSLEAAALTAAVDSTVNASNLIREAASAAILADEGDIDTSRQAWWWCTPTWGYNYGWSGGWLGFNTYNYSYNYSYANAYSYNSWYQPYYSGWNYGGWNYSWFARLF